SPEVRIGIFVHEGAAAGPFMRGDRDAQGNGIRERLCEVLVVRRDVKHLVLPDGYCLVPQIHSPRSLEHDHHGLPVVTMRVRTRAFLDFKPHHTHGAGCSVLVHIRNRIRFHWYDFASSDLVRHDTPQFLARFTSARSLSHGIMPRSWAPT